MLFLDSLQWQNVMFLFSMKHSYLLTANTPPDVHNSLIFTWYERATVGNSLHVWSNFCCLIMTSTKLMQYVTSFSLVSKFTRNINHRYFIFLFELPNRMPITGSYLLPSFSLVTLEKILLIKKVWHEIN